MSDEKESSRGRLFKIATVAGILGMFLSGFCFGSCLVLVARIRIPEFFDTPLGFKRTPLVGISAVADSALYPSLAALALFWLFFGLCSTSLRGIRTSGSLLPTRQNERDVVEFSQSCPERVVLPTWGTAELLQAQGFGQPFLDEALGGDHGGGSIG